MKLKFLLFLFFTVPLVFAQQVPILPAVYKGYINSACNINGAKLQAYINNELRGETIIYCQNNICWYGSIKGLQYADLAVSGKPEENGTAIIEFYVYINGNKVKLDKTDIFVSGQVKILNFTVTSEQCNILFPSVPTYVSPTTGPGPTIITTKEIEEKLKELGIKAVIEKIIPIQNITEVKVEYNTTLKIKPKVEEVIPKPEIKKVIEKIKEELVKLLKKEIKVEVKPIETKINVQLIKIITKGGKEKIFTKIEKEVKVDKVIEVVPKDLAETADEIIWLKGKIFGILEKDPVFEVSPEDNKIAYLVEGDKTEEALKTITLTYSYEIIEKPVVRQNVTNITKPEIKPNITVPQNVTKPKANITTQKKPKKVSYLPLIIILAVIIGVAVYFLRRAKPSS